MKEPPKFIVGEQHEDELSANTTTIVTSMPTTDGEETELVRSSDTTSNKHNSVPNKHNNICT